LIRGLSPALLLECIFGHLVFEAVGYGEIQRDDTARYSGIQLDTVGYNGIYSASAAKWIDIESIQGYTGYHGYGEIQAGYR